MTFALAAVLWAAPDAPSGWGPSGCAPQLRGQPLYAPHGTLPQPLYAPIQRPAVYTWSRKDDGGACLWRDGVQVGYWDHDRRQYCPRDPLTQIGRAHV